MTKKIKTKCVQHLHFHSHWKLLSSLHSPSSFSLAPMNHFLPRNLAIWPGTLSHLSVSSVEEFCQPAKTKYLIKLLQHCILSMTRSPINSESNFACNILIFEWLLHCNHDYGPYLDWLYTINCWKGIILVGEVFPHLILFY